MPGKKPRNKSHILELMKTGQCAPPPNRRCQEFYGKLVANKLDQRFTAYLQICGEKNMTLENLCELINRDFHAFLQPPLNVQDISFMLETMPQLQRAYLCGKLGNDVSDKLIVDHMMKLALDSYDTKDSLNYLKARQIIATTKQLNAGAFTKENTAVNTGMNINLSLTVEDDDD